MCSFCSHNCGHMREFFSVSPLWLRGATAFAALLLCVLGVLMIARVSRQPVQTVVTDNGKRYTEQELKHQIDEAVSRTRAELTSTNNKPTPTVSTKEEHRHSVQRTQMVANQPKNVPQRNLNRQEREQLAADLRLTLPVDEEELLLALPEHDIPRQ